jgi:hypothetical protein
VKRGGGPSGPKASHRTDEGPRTGHESAIDPAQPPRLISRVGLIAGPDAALVLYLVLPGQYVAAAGRVTEFTHAGRATLAVLDWMAVW